MKNLAFLFSLILLTSGICHAQTSAFTYQGKLASSGAPANGDYQFEFKLFDGPGAASNQIGATQTAVATVQNGAFSTRLDFGSGAFATGPDRWLEIGVRPNGSAAPYTVLTPRQQINSVPFAVRSLRAVDSDNATNVTGVVALANGGTGSNTKNFVDLSSNQTAIDGDKTFTGTLSVSGPGGRFAGDGSGLTNVSTTVADGAITTAKLADGSVTPSKLAFSVTNKYDPQLVALMRWDLLPVVTNAFTVGREPSALAFDGTFIYVANKVDNNVTRINAATGVIDGAPIPVGAAPSALAFDGTFMWVANSGGNNVTKIRARTGVVEGSPTGVGNSPQALAFDGTFLYVANFGSNSVTRIRVASGAVEGDPIVVGVNPMSLVFTGEFVYVSHANLTELGIPSPLQRIRASSGLVEGSSIPHVFGGLAFDGTFVYASSGVERIRASTGVLESRPIALNPATTVLCFDGTTLYGIEPRGSSVNDVNSLLHKLNISSLGFESSIEMFGQATAMTFDGTYIYVSTTHHITPDGVIDIPVNGRVVRFRSN
jgi:DNA-binding beta-propeller fold protein YncE